MVKRKRKSTSQNKRTGQRRDKDKDKDMDDENTNNAKKKDDKDHLIYNGIPVGEIGYSFIKHFPGYGNFLGTVVEIRQGRAYRNKTRRCRYTDGDKEDLSITELYALEKAQVKRLDSARKQRELTHKKKKEEEEKKKKIMKEKEKEVNIITRNMNQNIDNNDRVRVRAKNRIRNNSAAIPSHATIVPIAAISQKLLFSNNAIALFDESSESENESETNNETKNNIESNKKSGDNNNDKNDDNNQDKSNEKSILPCGEENIKNSSTLGSSENAIEIVDHENGNERENAEEDGKLDVIHHNVTANAKKGIAPSSKNINILDVSIQSANIRSNARNSIQRQKQTQKQKLSIETTKINNRKKSSSCNNEKPVASSLTSVQVTAMKKSPPTESKKILMHKSSNTCTSTHSNNCSNSSNDRKDKNNSSNLDKSGDKKDFDQKTKTSTTTRIATEQPQVQVIEVQQLGPNHVFPSRDNNNNKTNTKVGSITSLKEERIVTMSQLSQPQQPSRININVDAKTVTTLIQSGSKNDTSSSNSNSRSTKKFDLKGEMQTHRKLSSQNRIEKQRKSKNFETRAPENMNETNVTNETNTATTDMYHKQSIQSIDDAKHVLPCDNDYNHSQDISDYDNNIKKQPSFSGIKIHCKIEKYQLLQNNKMFASIINEPYYQPNTNLILDNLSHNSKRMVTRGLSSQKMLVQAQVQNMKLPHKKPKPGTNVTTITRSTDIEKVTKRYSSRRPQSSDSLKLVQRQTTFSKKHLCTDMIESPDAQKGGSKLPVEIIMHDVENNDNKSTHIKYNVGKKNPNTDKMVCWVDSKTPDKESQSHKSKVLIAKLHVSEKENQNKKIAKEDTHSDSYPKVAKDVDCYSSYTFDKQNPLKRNVIISIDFNNTTSETKNNAPSDFTKDTSKNPPVANDINANHGSKKRDGAKQSTIKFKSYYLLSLVIFVGLGVPDGASKISASSLV